MTSTFANKALSLALTFLLLIMPGATELAAQEAPPAGPGESSEQGATLPAQALQPLVAPIALTRAAKLRAICEIGAFCVVPVNFDSGGLP